MSRIGKLPITLVKNVSVNYDKNVLSVKGPKGTLTQKFEPGFKIDNVDSQLSILTPSSQKAHKSLHGLYRSLVFNMVKGVSEGFEIRLELVGVGYRAESKGQILELSLGFSHQIFFQVPTEVKVETESIKGQSPKVILSGIDKQLVGQVAAKIRAIRKPEPYKGKGVRLSNEIVRRKAGKAAGKGKK